MGNASKTSLVKSAVLWIIDWRPAIRSSMAGAGTVTSTAKYLARILKKPKAVQLTDEEQHAWLTMTPHERWNSAKARHQWDCEFLVYQRKFNTVIASFYLVFGIALLALSVFFIFYEPFSIVNVLTSFLFGVIFFLWYAESAWRIWQIDNQFIRPLKDWLKLPGEWFQL
jgi:hypothetical protein